MPVWSWGPALVGVAVLQGEEHQVEQARNHARPSGGASSSTSMSRILAPAPASRAASPTFPPSLMSVASS